MPSGSPLPFTTAARRRVAVGLFGLSLLCPACDDALVAPAVPAACRQIGQQCQRPEGPIGVCQETKCPADASPPCYVCTSQH